MRNEIDERTSNVIADIPSDDYSRIIISGIEKIHDIIPKSGRTAYKYMPSNVKEEINKLSHFIIDNNSQFQSAYDEICNLRRCRSRKSVVSAAGEATFSTAGAGASTADTFFLSEEVVFFSAAGSFAEFASVFVQRISMMAI